MATYTLADLVSRYDIEVRPNGYANCPFCGDRRHKLHFDFARDFFRCNVCGASGRVLHFFARMQYGLEQLPSSTEGRQKISLALAEFMGEYPPAPADTQRQSKGTQIEVHTKPDAELHAVYSALYEIPELSLSKEHFEDLTRRGLTPEDIQRNGYRTIPEQMKVPEAYSQFVEESESKEELKKCQKAGRKLPPAHAKAGLYLADILVRKGFDLSGVPGFFQFRGRWCLRYIPGILIPTRNLEGQIVVSQIRRKTEPKYITLSCGGWTGAVTDSVSRCHFPLGNAPIGPGKSIVLTEGPLKADVAVSLSRGSLSMVAIPGINTTADFYARVPALTALGVSRILNGLDMDRLTNPNVGKGAAQIRRTLQKQGVPFQELYWGQAYAEYKLPQMEAFAFSKGLRIHCPPEASVFDRLYLVSQTIWKADWNPCSALICAQRL